MANDEPELWIDPDLRAGVWASRWKVTWIDEEFVIDLACSDPDEEAAILVARVRCSPFVAKRLAESLNENWRRYARSTFPKEVTDAEPELGSEQEDDQGPDEPG